jgi:hypothetical protein
LFALFTFSLAYAIEIKHKPLLYPARCNLASGCLQRKTIEAKKTVEQAVTKSHGESPFGYTIHRCKVQHRQ